MSPFPQLGRAITPVILSGGSGTRLWPLSRRMRPKQLLPLVGERSMLQLTADRVAEEGLFGPVMIVAGEGQAASVMAEFVDEGRAEPRLILEPSSRNTAPAIALAALAAQPDELLLVMPSDHLIANVGAFTAAVQMGRQAAEDGWLVTFGIRPTEPATGYGYISRGEEIAAGVFRADRFVEKPDAATAAAYLRQGSYDWNAGIFLFKASAYLEALGKYAPDIAQAVRHSLADTATGSGEIRPDAAGFSAVRAQSIDHAVMEHASNVAVIPIDAGWSDVGSWQSLHEVSDKDANGNVLMGDVQALGATGCLVRSEGPLVVAIGVQDLAIVVTGDAVLVVPRNNSQQVSQAVSLLIDRGDDRI